MDLLKKHLTRKQLLRFLSEIKNPIQEEGYLMFRKIFILLILTIFTTFSLFAGTTGKLAGKVTDEDNKPVPFVNIILEGTTIGAQTKTNGTYIIINIPPGTYTAIFSQMGFQTQKITNVQINLDETTVQNVTMTTSAVTIDGYVVSERKIERISKSSTTSGNKITGDAIEDMAVSEIEDVISVQAGATVTGGELIVRGGRVNEVVYMIDGMSVSDPVDGGSALSIDTDAVEVMDPKFGGFPAEYGNAQSGIINIVTKSGSKDYSGKVELISDHLIEGTNNSNSDEIKFAIGGPVLTPLVQGMREKFTFFLNGTGNWFDTRYKDEFNPDLLADFTMPDGKQLLSSYWNEVTTFNPYENRNDVVGFDLGDRNINLYNANLKLKYKFNAKQNLTFAVRGDKNSYDNLDDDLEYSHAWKYALEYFNRTEINQKQFVTTYDHLFNPQMNLKIKGSYFIKETVQGPKGISRDDYFNQAVFSDDEITWISSIPEDLDNQWYIDYLTTTGLYENININQWLYDVNAEYRFIPNFVTPGMISGINVNDESSQASIRSDFEYQLNQIHGFKTGFEFIQHKIKKDQWSYPWNIEEYRFQKYIDDETTPIDSIYNSTEDFWVYLYTVEDLFAATLAASGDTEGYEANPLQAAYYIQDKMEWEGMIVNAGLRFDFWYLGEKYKILQDAGYYRWKYFDKKDRFQMMISPRFGISHPISETSVLHFAYNYQNQLPQMKYIFTTKTEEDAFSDPNTLVGDPTLEPQITVTYEVGLQKQLGEDSPYVLDITTYYKNFYNYIMQYKEYDATDETVSWFKLASEDYGSARGIDFNLQKDLTNFFSGSASYSLAWAEGNNPGLVVQDEATQLREFPLPWDLRNNFSFNFTFRIQNDEEYELPFTNFILPLDDFSINFLYNIASGRRFTPVNEFDHALDLYSSTQPYTENADLRVTKNFRFSEKVYMKLYLNIDNVFDKKNINYVYPKTASPYFDGADLSDENDYTAEEIQYVHDLHTQDPSNISQGRTFTFGMTFNF